VIGRRPGAAVRSGTISSFHNPSSGSARVRQIRRCFFALGGRGSTSMRRAVAADKPAFAAAVI
jgi:hypothetical protein